MQNKTNTALLAVLGFGTLMILIAAFLMTVRYQTGVDAGYRPQSADTLLGRWSTRTLAEDNSNGAYTGQIEFGGDYYQISNDVVHTPIRIDRVRYELDGNHIRLWVEGNAATPVEIKMLRHDRATISFADGRGSTLYMYRK
ncbi:hypothetical protein [Motiliproteus sediminis]|uniref:hypothetical protein n=1 Tax=Motiliproteus sediminis TaxID=1468178 RepID=UPI001AEF5BE6|nr:hypothetical protein [Motiliproteus sediminis]